MCPCCDRMIKAKAFVPHYAVHCLAASLPSVLQAHLHEAISLQVKVRVTCLETDSLLFFKLPCNCRTPFKCAAGSTALA